MRFRPGRWNDFPWLSSQNGGGAGGGGISYHDTRPFFQSGLSFGGGQRLAPDLAAHASVLPGWPATYGSNWAAVGGTSAATPLLAAGFAVLSARERAAGRPPLGPVSPLMYSLAASDPATVFDITSGNNQAIKKVPGRYAGIGYDLASGLGVPQFSQVATALPAPGSG